jgi:hypothetical protein
MKTLTELLAQLTALESENAALKAQSPAQQSGGITAADAGRLTAERDTLKAENLTLRQEVAALTAAQNNFDLRLAEELCKSGIRSEGIRTNHKAAEDDGAALVKKASARAKHLATEPL